MQIDPSFAASLTQTTPTTTSPGSIQKDQFLKLLVAQMQHQDPLNPQDGTAFVAQLAQFSSLEQATQTNEHLADLQAAQTAAARAALTGVVGHTVAAQTSTVEVGASGVTPLSAHLSGAATKVEAVITDASGKELRRISLGASPAGDISVPWDGNDAGGKALPPGSYHVEIEASGAAGKVPASALIQGVVTALEFSNGKAIYKIGEVTIDPADIIRIGG
jgi:flagellar basal-body rod modification protein FlgD